jgi:hypothetical protein
VKTLILLLLAAVAGCTLGKRPLYCTTDADCLADRQCVQNSCAPRQPRSAAAGARALAPSSGTSASPRFTRRSAGSPLQSAPVRSSPRYRMVGGLVPLVGPPAAAAGQTPR